MSTGQSTKDKVKAAVKGTASAVGSKALPVITEEEVGRIVDLGLGRGVDATDPSPWLHKSSFQVRRVTIENIIGTEEGGSMQSYEREVSSVTTQQTDLKASVAIPQAPVNLGLEGEQSRSVSTTRKAIGKRVTNRTISFASQFDDLPQSSSKSVKTEVAQKDTITPRVVYATPAEMNERVLDQHYIFNFEERLSKWILERVIHRFELAKKIEDKPLPPEISLIKRVNPCDDLSNYINAVDRDGAKQIVTDCADFVRHFRITHYVNSVALGAAQYRLFSESEYYTKIGAKGTFGFEALANLVISEKFTHKTTNKASDLRQIGRIVNEKVERGTYDEAVIGIGILPIHQLVQLRFLHLALRKALLEYIEMQGDTSSGPFHIALDGIYWKVNETNGFAIEGTRQSSQASLFSIIPTDNGDHPYEFLIGWQGDGHHALKRTNLSLSHEKQLYEPRTFRYLDGYVNILGRNSGPLYMRNDINEHNARFSLQSRLFKKHSAPVDLREWILGKDQYFLRCARRSGRIDGFLAMKMMAGRGNVNHPEFASVCVSSSRYHNERDTFMLFSLISPRAKESSLSPINIATPEQDLNEEFDTFIGDSSSEKFRFKDAPVPGKKGASLGLEMKEISSQDHL